MVLTSHKLAFYSRFTFHERGTGFIDDALAAEMCIRRQLLIETPVIDRMFSTLFKEPNYLSSFRVFLSKFSEIC